MLNNFSQFFIFFNESLNNYKLNNDIKLTDFLEITSLSCEKMINHLNNTLIFYYKTNNSYYLNSDLTYSSENHSSYYSSDYSSYYSNNYSTSTISSSSED